MCHRGCCGTAHSAEAEMARKNHTCRCLQGKCPSSRHCHSQETHSPLQWSPGDISQVTCRQRVSTECRCWTKALTRTDTTELRSHSKFAREGCKRHCSPTLEENHASRKGKEGSAG